MPDTAYHQLCLSGYAGGPEFADWWAYPRPTLQAWLNDQAFPWWRAIVEEAAADGLAVHCFVGERPDSGDPPAAAARLLHPWTATSFPDFRCADAKEAGWVAITRWRELAATAPPELAEPPDASVVADYARLRAQNQVAALYGAPRERIRPWFLQLVRLAHADGLLIHCRESWKSGRALFTTATLLDPATGLSGDAVAEFLEPGKTSSRLGGLLQEARASTDGR